MVNFYNNDRAVSGNTPRQRAKRAAIAAQDAYLNRISEQEKIRRGEPITGTVTGWDVDQGSAIVSTPDGGQVLARPISNANIIGKRLPVQRFAGAQDGAVSETPLTDLSEVYGQLESQSQALVSRMGAQVGSGDPNNETVAGILDVPPRYANDFYYDLDSGTLYRWNIDATPAAEWQPLQQLYQGFTGIPAADVRIDGAAAINDTGVVYTGTISGGWVGATEDIDVVIDTGNGTYPIITSSSIAYTVRAITSSGTGTGTLSPTIDADIAIGGTLNLTLSGNDDSRWSATIRLQRK